ncbi:hypothetical protein ACFLRP_03560 [Bacteroidota bacterium]
MGNRDAQEAQEIVENYLYAIQSGDMELARSYWIDLNDPGGEWTLVAGRDMRHVTEGHRTAFASGFEITYSTFESFTSLKHEMGVLKLGVLAFPGKKLKKLEAGLVRHEGQWYIYSIYPGTW